MIYYDLYSDFCDVFKNEIDTLHRIQADSLASDDNGMHVLFGMVVTPFVIGLIEANDIPQITKAFEYFEKMALSGSPDICEVLEFSVLESLISSTVFQKCKKYMLPETKKCCEVIEAWSL